MNKGNGSAKGKSSPLVIVLYVIAALMAVLFVWMVWANVKYIIEYTASYGMSFSDMGADAVKYIITESISYIVYAVIIFTLAKLLCAVRKDRQEADGFVKDSEEEMSEPEKEAVESITEDTEVEATTEDKDVEAVEEPQKQEAEQEKISVSENQEEGEESPVGTEEKEK